ncbi:MAG: NAD(P)H-hydrate dehydratase [Chloroflexi bacterium]|nr:NAD(P)H-hydrate dehydratase [Chloroflexota bacterium]
MKVATIREVREIEAAADRSGMSYEQMMLNAGAAASRALRQRWTVDASTRITFLVGTGNNGGDGLVMARSLALSTEADINLYLLAPRSPADENYRAALEAGLPVALATDDDDRRRLKNLLLDADIIVDAVLGIGARLPLRGAAADVLATTGNCLSQRAKYAAERNRDMPAELGETALPVRPFVFAVDCPSGIDCDTGEADEHVIAADMTTTFIAAKPGLLTFPAAAFVGDLDLSPIGIPESLPELEGIKAEIVDSKLAACLLPPRPLDSHKGTYGKAMIVAGSPNYIGAISLAGEAAYRAGAGLVTIATAAKLTEIVAGSLREPTWLPLPHTDGAIAEKACQAVVDIVANYDTLLVGCGLGLRQSTSGFLRQLLTSGSLPPLILDADALNILSRAHHWWKQLPHETVITPHAGEMARLTGKSAKEINANRWEIAREYSTAWNVALLLKGAHTLIAAPDGRISVIPFKSDALSKAGTGDALAGLIAGLRAQGLGAYDSARLGAYLHAAAGIIAAATVGSSRSVVAGDVLSAVGSAFATLESL